MRRDFEKFFTKLQLDFNRITKEKEKIDEEYSKNMLSDEQYANFISYYNAIKTNYDRVHYVRYLLHKPPKLIDDIINKITTSYANNELKKYFKDNNADDEAVLDENDSIILKVEEEFDECKNL